MKKPDNRRKNGGSRPNSGRKKLPPGQKKKPVTVWVRADDMRSFLQKMAEIIKTT